MQNIKSWPIRILKPISQEQSHKGKVEVKFVFRGFRSLNKYIFCLMSHSTKQTHSLLIARCCTPRYNTGLELTCADKLKYVTIKNSPLPGLFKHTHPCLWKILWGCWTTWMALSLVSAARCVLSAVRPRGQETLDKQQWKTSQESHVSCCRHWGT